ncbi:sensor histidine kinase [Paenibacillus sp. CC-CFT747]|nr:sensor histidine kinase [Paenibacillus sp. CC-CFT747]
MPVPDRPATYPSSQRKLYLLMLLAVPLAGELKFYPFPLDFRVSLGTSVFLFFLLWLDRFSPLLCGLGAGAAVMLFRMVEDGIAARTAGLVPGSSVSFWDSLVGHYPAFSFYLTYAGVAAILGLSRYRYRPALVGGIAVAAETAANLVELAFRTIPRDFPITLLDFGEIVLLAVIRSFFALGFYTIVLLRQSEQEAELQRRQKERILLLVSDLYQDAFHLKKTLTAAERITRDGYDLYRRLNQTDNGTESAKSLAPRLLRLAGEVHDIKKDNQRIYAGLSRLITREGSEDYLPLKELGEILLQANRNYAALLGKTVTFTFHAPDSLPVHAYTVLSLLNNLVANAVEALEGEREGHIRAEAFREGDRLILRVEDNGPGIPERSREVVFEPGFTTKYDSAGEASTGIGLSYVRQTVQELGGSVRLDAGSGERPGTVFRLELPLERISPEEEPHALLHRG